MSKLSLEEVEHIAKLSKLYLSDDEKELYRGQLSSVLEYVEELQKVETEGVTPTANITGLENIYREDGIRESGITHEDIAKNAPEFKKDSFVVPGVFE
jgi:aspartyl-tRNA(Asn)/glutamyl-tRNA(Gln) amidotransferase subunit C